MPTLTLNRNLTNDDLFIAMNDTAYADLKGNWNCDCSRNSMENERIYTGNWTTKLRKLFH